MRVSDFPFVLMAYGDKELSYNVLSALVELVTQDLEPHAYKFYYTSVFFLGISGIFFVQLNDSNFF